MPGAEGAPLVVLLDEVFVVEAEWLDGGAMRSDCRSSVSIQLGLMHGRSQPTIFDIGRSCDERA